MLFRPILKENYQAYAVYGEGHVLLSDADSFALEGHILSHLLPLLNGENSRDDIVALLSAIASAEEVYAALDYLTHAGHLREADPDATADEALFWSSLGINSQAARAQLAQCPVTVLAPNAQEQATALAWAQSAGLSIDQENGCIKLVIVEDYLDENLRALNAELTASGDPWLLVRPWGLTPLVGPLFIPGTTGCWECLETRLLENRDVEVMLAGRMAIKGAPPRPVVQSDAFYAQALATATTQLMRYIVAGANPEITGVINQLMPLTLERKQHSLLHRPQCACCGDPQKGLIGGAPKDFEVRQSAQGVENGERSMTAAETYARYAAHVSPLTGVIKDLTPSPYNGVTPLRTYSAGNNLAVKPAGLWGLKQNLRSVSSGKGRTDTQARTSALCEALERYSGKFRGEEIRIPASLDMLGDSALHPNELMLYSDQQYADREAWNARGSQFQIVPENQTHDEIVEWTPVWSITQKRMKYLPTSMLFYSYPAPDNRFTSWADSNGAAAGSSYEDACLQGLMELVERDSVAIWWYNRLAMPEVDLTGLDDAFVAENRAFYAEHKREFHVLDITTDLGIPSFVAINRRTGGPTEDIVMGFGAHLDARVGIMRAITEMNQFMPAVLSVGVDGRTHYAFDDPDSLNWWQTATYDNQPYLVPEGPARKLTDYAPLPDGDITHTLRTAIQRVEEAGHEVLVIDQTRADIGLPVVRVFAPGLRHFWARYAPGRLYDVPVKMGRLDAPLREDQLNPIAMFL
ncbi:TOMM precursor leader peptide-binding protein [Shimia sp. R11_0]|uniref:TOMM precursor leader peptide-binding protein n=1 Tax=Shimia sp. R11_0 TaxID=2821096 RepID=UPI001ADB3D64|nr:TOMM precursor leader peptide-binding protein [Shimia sp. R11_0]MBO9478172.1 TOMM precursor leader peptide-binding protein [Shimia sp. R11_0]